MSLPNFIVAGGRRCGTTSLYHWLSNHHQIYMFPQTDTAYFIDSELVGRTKWLRGILDYAKWESNHSIDEYSSFFKPIDEKVAGEKSADILYWKPAHQRLKDINPNCKIVIQLRNPIDRAWSHYWNEVGKEREDLSFRDAIRMEEIRSKQDDYARHHLSYIARGNYAEGLRSLKNHFKDEQILVLIFEETRKDFVGSMNKIAHFLDVDPVQIGDPFEDTAHNSNWTMVHRNWARSGPMRKLSNLYDWFLSKILSRLWVNHPERQVKRRSFKLKANLIFKKPARNLLMGKEVKQELVEHFKPKVKELEELLGRSLSIWGIH